MSTKKSAEETEAKEPEAAPQVTNIEPEYEYMSDPSRNTYGETPQEA